MFLLEIQTGPILVIVAIGFIITLIVVAVSLYLSSNEYKRELKEKEKQERATFEKFAELIGEFMKAWEGIEEKSRADVNLYQDVKVLIAMINDRSAREEKVLGKLNEIVTRLERPKY